MSARRTLTLSAWHERLRDSLFFVPLVFVAGGIVLAEAMARVDDRLADRGADLPQLLIATTAGSRAVLTTVAAATITVAGIAFSIALLVVQLASSQYSPRVVGSLFRDPFNKRITGIVVGTFSYCLVSLRSTRALTTDSSVAVPAVSASVAVVLALVAVLAIVAFIDHSAHSTQVSELLHRITESTLGAVADRSRLGGAPDEAGDPRARAVADGPGFAVDAASHGWLQLVDAPAILAAVPAGSVVRMETAPGRYVAAASPLCTVWPPPAPADEEALCRAIRDATHVGRTRTMQQDIGYGIRQLADVAIKALSPGINDPTTAQDAIFHLVPVLQAALALAAPAPWTDGAGRVLIPAEDDDHRALVRTAFEEIRADAASRPAVCIYLLEAMQLVDRSLSDGAARDELRRQARLVVEGCAASTPLPADLAVVRDAYEQRFGPAR